MRHNNAFKKLNRTPAHRRALLRNLATSLVLHDQIETTLPKAKALKRVADGLVTLAKEDNLHNRRQAMQFLFAINRRAVGETTKLTAVHKLFTEIAPKFAERNGGYTRVIRTRLREGDKAQMAVIQFVEGAVQAKEKKGARKRRVGKAAAEASPKKVESAEEAKA